MTKEQEKLIQGMLEEIRSGALAPAGDKLPTFPEVSPAMYRLLGLQMLMRTCFEMAYKMVEIRGRQSSEAPAINVNLKTGVIWYGIKPARTEWADWYVSSSVDIPKELL